VYQKVIWSVSASHREHEPEFLKLRPYQTMCFDTAPTAPIGPVLNLEAISSAFKEFPKCPPQSGLRASARALQAAETSLNAPSLLSLSVYLQQLGASAFRSKAKPNVQNR
jgi:hypothetical protein